ncbi:MAG: hypothetical protein PUG48_07240 [Clostridia bacterium]|nr:hypothetical protein [Clostridia bacterium]
MPRLTSISTSADYFKKCIVSYLESKGERKYNNDDDFWELISSISFEDEKLSPNCPLFIAMKSYADAHPLSKSALIWQVNFENAKKRYIQAIILHLIEKKEDKKARKENSYSAAIDSFSNYLHQIKYKMKVNGMSDYVIDQFEMLKVEWQESVKSEIEDYKQFDEPLDDNFSVFISNIKKEIREKVSQLTNGVMFGKNRK